jgi:hypothetical protein
MISKTLNIERYKTDVSNFVLYDSGILCHMMMEKYGISRKSTRKPRGQGSTGTKARE